MKKPTLLYASPFPPKASGISDYSVVLVKALSAKFDITLYIEDYEITDKSMKEYPIVKDGVDIIDFEAYDYKLYNMGNNADFHTYIYEAALEHPGVVIQHDLVLYNFVFGYYKERKNSYFSTIYKKFGLNNFVAIREAAKDQELGNINLASKLPLNEELIKSGNRFIAHSEYTRNLIIDTGLIDEKNVTHINLIPQIDDDAKIIERSDLFDQFNVPKDAFVICSFGYIQSTKLNLEICHVIRKLSKILDKKICYVMVGKGDYADSELEENLIIKTGFTELDEFNSFVEHADIIVNLRNPTMGETSAAMLRLLQLGKACITNNGGWFTELPDDCVCKIELDDIEGNLEKALAELIQNENDRVNYEENAKIFIEREYNKGEIIEKMFEFIRLN